MVGFYIPFRVDFFSEGRNKKQNSGRFSSSENVSIHLKPVSTKSCSYHCRQVEGF